MKEMDATHQDCFCSWKRRAKAAEKTVHVLKRKVRSMYQNGVQSTIYRQLERARKRDEANLQRRKILEAREEELRRYNKQLEKEVKRRTHAMQTILDNVTFGFLVIGRHLQVREGFTRSCHQLFGKTLKPGDELHKILELDENRSLEYVLGVDQVFEDIMPEEVTIEQLPSFFTLNGRDLQLESSLVRAENGEVDSLLVTVSDITELKKARQESRHNEVLVSILKSKTAFEQFAMDTRMQLECAKDSKRSQAFVRRVVHTVKGNAASYGLDDVVWTAHKIEMNSIISTEDLCKLDQEFRAFLAYNYEVLGLRYDELHYRSFEVSELQVQKLKNLLDTDNNVPQLRYWAAQLIQRPAGELLGPVQSFVEKLSKRLGKEVYFSLKGQELLVDAELMRPIIRNLPHLIRNAVDHGLEASFEREGKPEVGWLQVSIEDDGLFYQVTVEDDGRGIDLPVLCKKAIILGLETSKSIEKMTAKEKLELIFHKGLSSSSVATDISGRGVGMSSVQAAVQEQGGSIEVHSVRKMGTTIQLRIPKPDLLIRQGTQSSPYLTANSM